MYTLLRLPLILLELALRQGAGALKDILHLIARGEDEQSQAAARREAEVVAAEEARARRSKARRPVPAPAPATPAAPAPEAELLGEAPAHVSRGAETVASFGPAADPSPTIEVQAPWDDYDAHPAAEVIERIRVADEATKAVVLLYERGHKGRTSVIRAAGGARPTA